MQSELFYFSHFFFNSNADKISNNNVLIVTCLLFIVMRKAFQMFDTTKSGFIETSKISTILNTMGQLFDDIELRDLINENDPNGE